MRQFPRVPVSRSGRLARFTFLTLVGAAALMLAGCREYALGNPGGARSTATQVLKAARVSWALPPD